MLNSTDKPTRKGGGESVGKNEHGWPGGRQSLDTHKKKKRRQSGGEVLVEGPRKKTVTALRTYTLTADKLALQTGTMKPVSFSNSRTREGRDPIMKNRGGNVSPT